MLVGFLFHHVSRLPQIIVQHPAAKSMIEISRTQDEEVGDGTTSVIILGKVHGIESHVSPSGHYQNLSHGP